MQTDKPFEDKKLRETLQMERDYGAQGERVKTAMEAICKIFDDMKLTDAESATIITMLIDARRSVYGNHKTRRMHKRGR